MNVVELPALAIVLAMDASLYAFSCGLTLRKKRCATAWNLAILTALFQAVMPLLGYVAGAGLMILVSGIASWVICVIFCTLGVVAVCRRGEEQAADPLGLLELLLVAFATSIDAFAVGICFAMARLTTEQLFYAAAVIGIVTLLSVLICFYLSGLLRRLPERFLQILSGSILIALGLFQVL